MSRLTIDVTDQQHQNLKAMAALEGKTIKQYALERLFPAQQDEGHALADLNALLHERLTQVERGEIDTRSITEIATSVLQTNARHD
jgi:Antitoxin ParD